jgi:hypothetical protein
MAQPAHILNFHQQIDKNPKLNTQSKRFLHQVLDIVEADKAARASQPMTEATPTPAAVKAVESMPPITLSAPAKARMRETREWLTQ